MCGKAFLELSRKQKIKRKVLRSKIMNGIEILSSQEVVTKFAFNWSACLIAGFVIFGICLLFGILISIESYDWSNVIMCATFGVFVSILFGCLAGTITKIPVEYETQYKVLISDEVSMNDFNAKYVMVS